MKFQTKGLIDLGSNSIRFVVYKMMKNGNYKETLNVKRTARISMHIDENKNITAKGLEKIIKSLHYFKEIAKFHQVTEIECFATAVIREAPNQKYILKKIRKASKISVAVLSEFEEAYYGFIGATNATKVTDGVTIDIGGGSTEVTLFKNKILKHTHSFSFGAVTLAKDFIRGKNPTEREMEKLSTFLEQQFNSLPWLKDVKLPVVGVGGTARNLSEVFKQHLSSSQESDRVKMNKEDIRSTSAYLQSFSLRKRKKVAGLSKERADIIIPGIEAFVQFMEVVDAPSYEASSQGLREGLCYSVLFENFIKAK